MRDTVSSTLNGVHTSLSRLLIKAPLLSVVICCGGGIVGSWYWSIVVLILAFLCISQLWKQAVMACLCALLGATLATKQEHSYAEAQHHFTSAQNSAQGAVSGSIIREFKNAAWLEVEERNYLIELRSKEGEIPRCGLRYAVSGIAENFHPNYFEGSFDRAKWSASHGVAFYLPKPHLRVLGEGSLKSRILAASSRSRHTLSQILLRGADASEPRSHVLISLLLGDKSYASSDTIDLFRQSGSLHAFAVSGLHVGIIMLLLMGFFRLVCLNPKLASILCILLLGLYVFVTGLSISALRAYLMISLLLLGGIWMRAVHTANIWSFAGLVLLLLNPRCIFQPDFQLSFLIYGAIGIGVYYFQQSPSWYLPDDLTPEAFYTKVQKHKQRVSNKIRMVILVSLVAWLISLPLTAWHFGTINVYSVLTNAAMTPLLPCVIGMGLLGICFSWCPPLLYCCNEVARWLAGGLICIAEMVGGLPYALTPVQLPARPDHAFILSYNYGAYSAVLGNPALLLDAGKETNAKFSLIPTLLHFSVKPNALLITHPHASQSQGGSALFEQYPTLHHLQAENRVWQASSDSKFSFFASITPPYKLSADAQATIVRWDYKSSSLLYIGDAPLRRVLELDPKILRADIVIIGFNPNDPADDLLWLQKSQPKYLILRQASHITDDLSPHTQTIILPEQGATYIQMDTLKVTVSQLPEQ